ncbi:LysR family transcriptional regulator [Streptomyces sp. A1136]|uniref:LysR family transcriptional regulator n=1 Tax=Streptomyces sp. A1136 TaxID=2563102 RepID=UPI00109E5DC6|nr:LysR family transcriptional regulator [Streptomyces sp. A1136]THA56570.1 LysR family transcriptional regulator [Streptomyces sp. A1136]
MEMHQLRYFAAVVEEGSFTAAAARLHVSQSGVSTQVGKLERELGQRLLERSGRRTRLTPAGEAVLPLARQALETLDSIAHTAAEFAEAVRGRVRLGMIRGCSIPGLLDVVAGLATSHPGVELGLHEDDSEALRERVLARSLDLALIAFAGGEETGAGSAGLDVSVFLREPLTAVVPVGHRLDRASVRLSDLRAEKVLCLPPGTGIRAAYDRSCARVGLGSQVAIEAASPSALTGLARRGAGVAVLTRSSGAEEGMSTVPVLDAATPACLGLVIRPDQRSPATRLVLAALREALGREGD